MRTACPLRLLIATIALSVQVSPAALYIRVDQVGYDPREPKHALAFSDVFLPSQFSLHTSGTSQIVLTGTPTTLPSGSWGSFPFHADFDFSNVREPGDYLLTIGTTKSLPIHIASGLDRTLRLQLLEFMRQQRCGDNPWLGVKCHTHDGRTAFGPLPPGTAIDVSGGWHDAGDMLKYLMTSEDATANMLLACLIDREDHRDVPLELLDEANWGLRWMLKMHPAADQLYHQVGDDRDHAGFREPQNDPVDYGWGKGGPRVAYAADGKPQGLKQYKSESTGEANIAGLYTAAMGLAFQVYKDDPRQPDLAAKCLQAGREVYDIGRAHEGVQQGNSYGEPYRYCPTIWAGDMEWGAAELYRATREQPFLDDAIRYAKLAGDEGWMGKEKTDHYQFFPFTNVGHYRLFDLVDGEQKKLLADDYRAGIERCVHAGQSNPYQIGVPFIWCSNNLAVALATQCHLYERMTGDAQYHAFGDLQRDWLLGRNPWGTTMFTGIGSVYPRDAHLMTFQLLHRPVRGGLVDGPVYESIFKSLKGVGIRELDPLASFQGLAVYHDDGKDYSTNEPTLDGTAAAILMFTLKK